MKMLNKALLLLIFVIAGLQLASGQKVAVRDSLPVMIFDGKPLIYLSQSANATEISIARRIGDSTGKYTVMPKPVYQRQIDPYIDALGRSGLDSLKKFLKVDSDDELLGYIATHRNIKNYSLYVIKPKFAIAAGVAFVDSTLTKEKKGKRVYYRLALDKGQGQVTYQGKFVTGQGLVLPKPRFSTKQTMDTIVTLTWAMGKKGAAYPPAMVNLYIKELSDTAFKPAPVMATVGTRKDSIFLSARSAVKPGVPTAFFIRPVDFLGNESVVPSDTITTYTVAYQRLPVVGVVTIKDTTSGIYLNWPALDSTLLCAGVQIQRSTSVGSGFTTVGMAAGNATEFTDDNARQGVLYYYRLSFVSPDSTAQKQYGGYVSMKHVSKALLPPPYSVNTVQLSKSVKVTWSPVPEARGYYIYRASTDSLSDLASISKLLPDTATAYIDTSKNVSRRNFYYYVVRSMNFAGKESVNSMASAIKFPVGKDKITAPNGLRLNAGETSMHLSWEDQKAIDLYVAGYNVYRRRFRSDQVIYTPGTSAAETARKYHFEKLNSKPVWQTAYEDNRYIDSLKFQYAVSALDVDGYEGPLSGMVSSGGFTRRSPELKAPKALTLSHAPNGGVLLKWQNGDPARKTSFVVYRRSANAPRRQKIATVETTTYIDKKATAKQKYTYEVVAMVEEDEGPGMGKSITL